MVASFRVPVFIGFIFRKDLFRGSVIDPFGGIHAQKSDLVTNCIARRRGYSFKERVILVVHCDPSTQLFDSNIVVTPPCIFSLWCIINSQLLRSYAGSGWCCVFCSFALTREGVLVSYAQPATLKVAWALPHCYAYI